MIFLFRLLAFLISTIICLKPDLLRPVPDTIYVSPDGSDWSSGKSPETPLFSVQYAADQAKPGATIVLLSGVYRERIVLRTGGRPGKPVTFKAKDPGRAVLSGVASGEAMDGLRWEPEGDGLFSTPLKWPVYRVKANGMELFPCRDLQELKKLTSRETAWGSFCWNVPENPSFQSGRNYKLYVWLPDGKTPSSAEMQIHGPIPGRLANGVWRAANVWVEADNVRFEGLQFAWGTGFGVNIFDGSDISFEGCLFAGSDTGIGAAPFKPVERLRVEKCVYHNYPQGEWHRKWLSWNEAYEGVGHVRFVASVYDGAKILNNLILHAADGMHVSTGDVPGKEGVEVAGNLIAFCTDDAVELDGFTRDVRFHGNLIYDCHESLGTSPVLAGPVIIEKNLFLHPAGGLNGAQVKLLSPWLQKGPPINGPIRNVEIRENTFVGNWMTWYGNPPTPVEGMRIHHNVFAVQRKLEPLWPVGVTHWENVYIDLSASYPDPAKDSRWWEGWKMERPGPRWLKWEEVPFRQVPNLKTEGQFSCRDAENAEEASL